MDKRAKSQPLYLTRWLILAGVMVGLFFSSGEGLQLLPFVDYDEGAYHGQGIDRNDVRSYAAANRNQSGQSTPLKFRAQKDLKHFTGASPLSVEARPVAAVVYTARQHREDQLSYSSNFLISPSGRAPPSRA